MFDAIFNLFILVGLPCFLEQLKFIVFQLVPYHQIIVYVTETSSRMASTLSQIKLTIFCQKAQNFVHLLPYDFVQISPACGPNNYQIMYGEILDFRCQRQYVNIKCLIGKSICAENLPLKLFRPSVANADTEINFSMHYLIRSWTLCWRNLNQIVLFEMYKILSFFEKSQFFKLILFKIVDPILKDVSVAETSV